MKDQGYELQTIIKEDNKSLMLLMKNGRLSSGKRTKHLDIRYFYVQNLIQKGIVKIEHCSTECMVADFFTKPLQGKIFQVMRDLILNQSTDSSILQYKSILESRESDNIVQNEQLLTK